MHAEQEAIRPEVADVVNASCSFKAACEKPRIDHKGEKGASKTRQMIMPYSSAATAKNEIGAN